MARLFEQRGGEGCFLTPETPRPLPPPNNNMEGDGCLRGGELFERKKDGGCMGTPHGYKHGDMATYNGGRTTGCCDLATRRKRLYMQTCGQLGHFLGTAHCLGTTFISTNWKQGHGHVGGHCTNTNSNNNNNNNNNQKEGVMRSKVTSASPQRPPSSFIFLRLPALRQPQPPPPPPPPPQPPPQAPPAPNTKHPAPSTQHPAPSTKHQAPTTNQQPPTTNHPPPPTTTTPNNNNNNNNNNNKKNLPPQTNNNIDEQEERTTSTTTMRTITATTKTDPHPQQGQQNVAQRPENFRKGRERQQQQQQQLFPPNNPHPLVQTPPPLCSNNPGIPLLGRSGFSGFTGAELDDTFTPGLD